MSYGLLGVWVSQRLLPWPPNTWDGLADLLAIFVVMGLFILPAFLALLIGLWGIWKVNEIQGREIRRDLDAWLDEKIDRLRDGPDY